MNTLSEDSEANPLALGREQRNFDRAQTLEEEPYTDSQMPEANNTIYITQRGQELDSLESIEVDGNKN